MPLNENAKLIDALTPVPRKGDLRLAREILKTEIISHKVPLTVLSIFVLTLVVCPPLLLIWLPFVLIWTFAESLYPNLPAVWRKRADRFIPQQLKTAEWFEEFSAGMSQIRPFLLAALYIGFVPLALIWMGCHWILRLYGQGEAKLAQVDTNPNSIRFVQNRRTSIEESESNFFHSPAFALTCITVFGCGLPAALTYHLYQALGIDAILGFPSRDPKFTTVFAIIGLYIYSIGWCLSVLFLRAWFTFPLNFIGDEALLEINDQRVKRRVQSWFTQVLSGNTPWAGLDSITWSEVKYIGYVPTAIKLYPLPTTTFSQNSPIYQILNKLAQFYDGVGQGASNRELIYLSTAQSETGFGSKLKIDLTDLAGDERARLFYALKKWAPDVVLDPRVRECMLGSTVMDAPRYTQMWFELLTDKMTRKRQGALAPDEKIRDGSLVIKKRISSGGQANIYLATATDGTDIVLKEFILSASDSVGALLESAGEFETESTLLSELKHERIVSMLDFFAEDRRLYIVLELVKGSSLRDYVKSQGPLPQKTTIELAIQIAEVLEYLHEQTPHIVHRDISPDNVIYDEESQIKVIDFSLAASKKCRRTTSTMGKHSYVPPEQLRENPCPQSDIYALGATMYFLLTGVDPKPISCSDVSEEIGDVDEKLNDVIKRATALELSDRYSEAKWMRLELEALL